MFVSLRRPKSGERFQVKEINLQGVRFINEYGQTIIFDNLVAEWEKSNQLLFDKKVLKRLAHPIESGVSIFDNTRLEELSDVLLDIPLTLYSSDADAEYIIVCHDLLLHLLRMDISFPGLYLTRASGKTSRDILKALMANSAFKFLLPKLSEPSPEQILEVRSAVEETREGFSMHLQSLSAEVEARINGGESLTEISTYADSVVEARLIPDFIQFKRQLLAERDGFWKNVLDKAGKILEIDATPCTPKFYGELLKVIGFTLLTSVEEQKEKLSNKNLAFQFMRTIEKTDIPST